MQISILQPIIYLLLILQINSQQCLKCFYALSYSCAACKDYCSAQSITAYKQCSSKNCSAQLQSTCQKLQNKTNNNKNVDGLLCINHCCAGHQYDTWKAINNQCLNANNSISIWSQVIMYVSIFAGCTLLLIIFACVYRNCRSNNNSNFISRFRFRLQGESTGATSNITRKPQSFAQITHSYLNPSQQSLKITEDAACPICLQANTDTITQCRHYFHIKCLIQWMKRSRQCPLCKSFDIQMVLCLCFACKKRFVQIDMTLVQRNFQFLGPGIIAGSKCITCENQGEDIE